MGGILDAEEKFVAWGEAMMIKSPVLKPLVAKTWGRDSSTQAAAAAAMKPKSR